MSKIQLVVEDVLYFHEEMERSSCMEKGVRDMGLLASAVNAPFQSFGGVELYPTLEEKAARLCYGLAKNHPFFDGNKRTALHSMMVFLEVNGCTLPEEDKVIEEVIVNVAAGEMSLENLELWLTQKVRYTESEGMWNG